MHGLMCNTKWREIFTLLSEYQIYVQLKLLGDDDFPLDIEQSDLVIHDVGVTSVVFVRKECTYSQIAQLKIITNQLPKKSEVGDNIFESLRERIKAITRNELIHVDDGLVLRGYA